MKGSFLVAVALIVSTSASAQESHSVRGYIKADGTYVAPHQQTNPNDTRTDNWSSRPNTNPYTGREGTRDPNAPKKPSGSSF